ncbi:hypothetical protein HXA34_20660 [Salipaludibacillus agaradhaerens]|uniref:hypothetical protein n=1 Tax=Salipaludibacillus agaradhaerens TaxID=76935 RepID=UPI002150B687|nr:hypothetical protein [Salipaludibacillus agaradhaerens]MCR6108712.1 hypothetical protein [Salipaludibacillus agaradhaerens]MCR6120735.1 hypothetical protein [Salipaludibacillus agaradhaerens]
MFEGAVMEYVKWLLGLISIMFIAVVVVFMFKLNEVNSFQQEVNYQIERHGGLTDEALAVLNEKAKAVYGGCLLATSDDGSPCLFGDEYGDGNMTSSGFSVREYQMQDDGTGVYINRGDEQARYGTPIHYVVTREIGRVGGKTFLKPAAVGMSSSRVRGTASE